MSNWKYFYIVENNIIATTAKALLITLPKHEGYSFWYPKKLVREDLHSKTLKVSICDNMVLTANKYSSGKKKEVVNSIQINVDDLIELFSQYSHFPNRSRIEKKIPETLTPEMDIKVDESLTR